jgi:flagellin-like hook-associated protein FlgL
VSTKNSDLNELHNLLGRVVDELVQKQEASNDPDTIRALAREIREVVFRVGMVQQLLFKEQTAAITAAVANVNAANQELADAIAGIDNLNNFIKTVSSFLGLVDKVIDLAKLV